MPNKITIEDLEDTYNKFIVEMQKTTHPIPSAERFKTLYNILKNKIIRDGSINTQSKWYKELGKLWLSNKLLKEEKENAV